MDVLAFRPCGACRAYVDLVTGCEHWQGGQQRTPSAWRSWKRRQQQNAAARAAREVQS